MTSKTHCQSFVLALLFTIFGSGESHAQLQENWVARYRGPAGGNDSACCIAVDRDGNVLVFGSSNGESADDVSALIKYDPAGNQLWVARDSGALPNFAIPNALGGRNMALDTVGNVYVTGVYWPTTNNSPDFITVKYGPNGTKLWSAVFNGPSDVSSNLPLGYSYDAPAALAVDGSGNVFVTGFSGGEPGTEDYVIIKYDSAGQQRWLRRYDGPAHGQDIPAAVAVDANGNVFVTGSSFGGGALKDFLTIKYDSEGNEMWTARYDGPFHSVDEAVALVIDAAGNAHVVGNSVGSGNCWGSSDSACQDVAVLKYDTLGNQLWVARHERLGESEQATGIVLSSLGDLYVTAGWGGLIKFDKEGELLWTSGYYLSESRGGGSVIWGGNALAVALGPHNRVHVTGFANDGGGLSYVTATFDENGNRRSLAGYRVGGTYSHVARALAVDATGRVHVTGSSVSVITPFSDDMVTIQYSPANEIGSPVITSFTKNVSVSPGENATLSVTATGDEPLEYRWLRRGWQSLEMHGATLTLSNLSVEDIADWSVEVSNARGTNVSPYVRVMVDGTPVIKSQPQDQVVLEGSGNGATFIIKAGGTPPLHFQWFKEGVPVESNRDYLSLLNPRAADGGRYVVVVTNAYGAVTSAPATLSVQSPVPVVTLQPQSLTNLRGASVTFVTGAYNPLFSPDPPRYQWQFNGNDIPGQTGTTLTITNAQPINEGMYRAVIINSFGSVTSAPATLLLSEPGPGWFANAQPIQIRDDSPGFPYPSEIEVSGEFGRITNLTVSLYGLEHDWPSDIDVLLVGPGGQSVLLMSDVGSGISVARVNLSFNKDAVLTVPQTGPLRSGKFRPANYGQIPDYFSAPAPAWPYGSDLSVFDGTNPNGTWRLFVMDDDEEASGLIAGGWRIDLQGDGAPPGIEVGALDRWHVRQSSYTNSPMGVTAGPNGFVAVESSGRILFSPDGYEWISRASGISFGLSDVVSGGGTFVAVGSGGSFVTSSDGTNWLRRVSATNLALLDVTYGGGRFVAVGESGTAQVSLDSGLNWQAVNSGSNRALYGVTYGQGLFVAVGSFGDIRVSTNGLNWFPAISTNTATLNAVAYGDGLFVAVGDNRMILTSPDGTNWTRRTALPNNGYTLQDVIYANGNFVCGGIIRTLLSSVNGVDWTTRSFPTDAYNIYGLASAGETLVAVCQGGTNVIYQSDPVQLTLPRIVRPPRDTIVRIGGATNLSIIASGTSPFTYRWRRDGVLLSGATERVLTFSNTQVSAEGSYTVTVESALGSITSAPAFLTVGVPPSIIVQPLNQEVVAGGTATFSISVSGTPPFTYRWRLPPSVFTSLRSPERQSFWTVTNAQLAGVGLYGVYVSNDFGGIVSRGAQLSLLDDADGDGLPDRWEANFGLNANDLADALLDLDGDGINNLEEYRAGTNPTNTSSQLRISTVLSENMLTLMFDAESNKTYTVEHSGTPEAPQWDRLLDFAARTNRRVESITGLINDSHLFYRVVTPRRP